MRELLINLFHSLDVEPADFCVVDHRFGVVHTDHTVCRLLHGLWGVPGFIDVPVWVVLQDGDIIPDVVSCWVCPPPKAHRTVAVEELLEEGTTRQPHPAASIYTPVCIQQKLLKHLHATLPTKPQVAPCKKTGHGMSGLVVDPAFLSQLGHDGVNPGETSPTLSPLGQSLWVVVPWDLYTDGVPIHAVKVGVVCGCRVEEFPP